GTAESRDDCHGTVLLTNSAHLGGVLQYLQRRRSPRSQLLLPPRKNRPRERRRRKRRNSNSRCSHALSISSPSSHCFRKCKRRSVGSGKRR
ncbi:hypothetical protein PENTCL1PPCAC_5785, partial [Pristionchus entomophagus]